MRIAVIVLGLMLAACSRPAPQTESVNGTTPVGLVDRAPGNDAVAVDPATANDAGPAPAATAAPADATAYLGRWIGVEGMFLNVTKQAGDRVSLEMQWDLDHKGRFDGTVTPAGITFTRDGRTETLVPSDGDATGLKYLAGKRRCLTVKSGEGYCRT